ncbi:MAG: ATP-binding cassette domain-containing protein [Chloroflexales bacterium]|nr:ATP-binding cassette domain-containing protein [Chloroflexales bacterium]
MIDAQRLSKQFGTVHAVIDLDLQVPQGSIYALLGPNGAGKSTTINMLTTLLRPDRGTIVIAGHDAVHNPDAVRRVIGVTFQDLVLDRDLSGREALDDTMTRKQRTQELLTLVELNDAADRMTGTYSGGMRRRLELARCLMMRPQVLFLDEPTQGLDPQHRAMIWDYLIMLQQQHGMTMLITTHAMDEAEILAQHVGIIDHGRMVASGTPADLIGQFGSDMVRIAANYPTDYQPSWQQADWVRNWAIQDGELRVGVDHGSRRIATILDGLRADNLQVTDMNMTRPSLGDVFLQTTGRALRDEVKS